MAMYREGGRLPGLAALGQRDDTMIGYHAVPVIARRHLQGADDRESRRGLDAMKPARSRTRAG